MDAILTFRLFLIPGALVVFFLVALIVKSPKSILYRVLAACWLVGIANFIVDVIQEHFGFWHYTISNLPFGYPIDLYIAVSLMIGAALPLIYWRLQFSHPKWIVPINFILPFYFLFQDAFIVARSGTAVAIWTSPYWWLADLISIYLILWVAFVIFDRLLRKHKMITDLTFISEGHHLSGTLYQAEHEKAAVLMLAGGANIPHKEGFYPAWQEQLADAGVTSFSFDFRGIGESEVALAATNINTRIADGRNAFDALVSRATSKNVFVLGVSLGGPVAIAVANLAHAAGLVLIVPGAYSKEARDKNFGPNFSAAIRKPESWKKSDFEDLKMFDRKIFLAYGTHDEVVPQDVFQTYSDIVRAKGGEVLVFESAGHRFMRESDAVSSKAREVIKERLEAFLT